MYETSFTTEGMTTTPRDDLLPSGEYLTTFNVANAQVRLPKKGSGPLYYNMGFTVVEGPRGSAEPEATAGRIIWHRLTLQKHMIKEKGGLVNFALALGALFDGHERAELGPLWLDKTEAGVPFVNKAGPFIALNAAYVAEWAQQFDGAQIAINVGIEKGSATEIPGKFYPDKNKVVSFVEVLAAEQTSDTNEEPEENTDADQQEQADEQEPESAPEPAPAPSPRRTAPSNGKPAVIANRAPTRPVVTPAVKRPVASARPTTRRR